MPTATELVQEFIDVFVAAWPVGDAERVASYFSDDAVYHNMPLEPARGRDAIRESFVAMMVLGGEVRVDMLNLLADGRVVMTERVDHFVLADKTISLPVMGTFEISNGKIDAWRDYFDLAPFTAAFSGG